MTTVQPVRKPMLAEDWQAERIQFPVLAQPKIDGVRGWNPDGRLIGRNLRPYNNVYTTRYFSQPEYAGFDGELAAEAQTHPALCRLTTSAVNTIKGEPYVLWWLFDYVPDDATAAQPYVERLTKLAMYYEELQRRGLAERLRVVPSILVESLEHLETLDAHWTAQGFEGTCFRGVSNPHKQGSSSPVQNGLLRIKRFVEEDAVVMEVIEGRRNENEAKVNALGHTERSSHAEGMVPNGLVGALLCRDMKTGKEITVSAGALTAGERAHYFKQRATFPGTHIKYRTFPHGVKDKPRFPTLHVITQLARACPPYQE